MKSSYGKSIKYIAESPLINMNLHRICLKKKIKFSNNRSNPAADSFIEFSLKFENGNEHIKSVQFQVNGVWAINYSGIFKDLHKKIREKTQLEPASTRIKRKHSLMNDTIEFELTISFVFQTFYHLINPEQLIDISINDGVRGDFIASLES